MAAYAKAIISAIVAGLTGILAGMAEDSASGTSLTGAEWVVAIVAFLVALGAVWAVPNRPAS